MRDLRGPEPARRVGIAALLALTAAAAACGPPGAVAPAPADVLGPASRPDDGLLVDAELQELVDLQVRRDGAALAEFLDDPDPAVRARAAFALASVQDPQTVPALLERLDDPDARVRADAAFAAGRAGGPDAAAPLLDALDGESDPEVRALLLEAVASAGDADALQRLLAADPPEADPAHPGAAAYARALARFGLRGHAAPAATDWLVEALVAAPDSVRVEAARFFGRAEPSGAWADRAGALRAALDSAAADDPAAHHLVAGLGALGAEEDTDRLLDRLGGGGDWRIRVNAARAVAGRRGRDDVLAALTEALDDPSIHVARAAAEALAPLVRSEPERLEGVEAWLTRSPDRAWAAAPLLDALGYAGRTNDLLRWTEEWSSADASARSRVLHALTRAPGSRADSVLLRAVRTDDPERLEGAVDALLRRWPLARADSALHARYYAAFGSALREGGRPARKAASALGDEAFRRFGSVARLLEAFRDEASDDGDPYLRATLVEGLGRAAADRDRVEPVLRRALDDPHVAVREAARTAAALLAGADPPEATEDEPPPAVDWEALAELGSRPRLVFETDAGRIVVALDAEEAPLTVQTIAGLAQEGRYDGTPFHRVVPNFVAQTGDFVRGDGQGRPGFTLRTESTRIPFVRGVAGMASAGRDTEGSQFFLTHSPQAHLDAGYTAFGWVVEGAEVLDRIREGHRLRSVRVERGTRSGRTTRGEPDRPGERPAAAAASVSAERSPPTRVVPAPAR